MMQSPFSIIVDELFRHQLPFVLFRIPGGRKQLFAGYPNDIHTYFSPADIPQKRGFLVAPFIVSGKTPLLYFMPSMEMHEENVIPISFESLDLSHSEANKPIHWPSTTKQDYLKSVLELSSHLFENNTNKVVLSRIKTIEPLPGKSWLLLFDELCRVYPAAFVYLFHFQPYGTWMGATPETLLSCRNRKCSTMSLAGTRKTGKQGGWGRKELIEHQIVSEFIISRLTGIGIGEISTDGPFTVTAARVEHLCTLFRFELPGLVKLATILEALHPTPAVCGFPVKEAFELIQKYETHPREYYTGYLGPVDDYGNIEAFVNLRCMKITGSQTLLYVGGGITAGSVPEAEWEETELKSLTLLNPIKKIRNFVA